MDYSHSPANNPRSKAKQRVRQAIGALVVAGCSYAGALLDLPPELVATVCGAIAAALGRQPAPKKKADAETPQP